MHWYFNFTFFIFTFFIILIFPAFGKTGCWKDHSFFILTGTDFYFYTVFIFIFFSLYFSKK
ncbi:hypothetical protein PERMA_0204 [Persephonella marina EX-H1]|uniref:Uncharacterized protein n=1 Tax=Persephonella marina (strain DSM 14350 / EX-H1) TaxID=123214 RepID=C0QTI6_PERMH|nr:hypothetical protein PERMA_0204 [Persephonella marina EX-H1]